MAVKKKSGGAAVARRGVRPAGAKGHGNGRTAGDAEAGRIACSSYITGEILPVLGGVTVG